MHPLRIWLVGHGTVGRWLVDALDTHAERLHRRYGAELTVVGIANGRDGLVYDGSGLDLSAVRALSSAGSSLTGLPGVRHWPVTLDGLHATEADVLVEVSQSPATDGEPGLSHLRAALGRRIPAVTSNKWPVALHGVELAELARSHAVQFRAESTVMSGTPVLSTLTDGLAGAVPIGVRGLLNATTNAILTRMTEGLSYPAALAEAQAAGLAERDPSADVEGPDTGYGGRRRERAVCAGRTGRAGDDHRPGRGTGTRRPRGAQRPAGGGTRRTVTSDAVPSGHGDSGGLP